MCKRAVIPIPQSPEKGLTQVARSREKACVIQSLEVSSFTPLRMTRFVCL